MSETEDHDRPMVELFVKAAVDKMKSGGCPICQRYFMIFYILREKGLIDLIVTTFLPENPPKEILDFSTGKHFPLVKVRSGKDKFGKGFDEVECDTVDEIEALVDRFECDEMRSRKESDKENLAEQAFDRLYTKFNQFVRSDKDEFTCLLKALLKLDTYLDEMETDFLAGVCPCRADCYLLPTLQHIRVAGKAYKNFDIPAELEHVWAYLNKAYQTDTFLESCPADREIVNHYFNKVSNSIAEGKLLLMGDDRSL